MTRVNVIVAAIGMSCLALGARAEDYVVVYDGAPKDLVEKLEAMTHLSRRRQSYPTAAAIRRVGNEDRETIRKALVAAGYYAATLELAIEPGRNGEPTRVVFAINPGPRFRIAEHRIVYEDAREDERPTSFEAADVKVTDRADGATLASNQERFLAALWRGGFPRARMTTRRAEAKFQSASAEAIYAFESGPRARFAGVAIEGAKHADKGYIEKLRTFQEGELFDRERLVQYRDRLAATGLFSTIDVAPGPVSPKGAAPVEVSVVERKRRTVGVGASFSTSEGPGGRLFFEYRNAFGHAERARLELHGTRIEQSARFNFSRPLPGFPGSAYADAAFRNETPDAYDARSFSLGAGLSKSWLKDRLETRLGLGLETTRVEPNLMAAPGIREERNYFASAPASATWNTEDDPLALSKGARVSLFATPYTGSDRFTRLEAVARSRINFGEEGRFTFAGRMRLAATTGQALRTLPVNKRVYSGGGSSVRGYDYQAVGPLDTDGVPIGGRSAVEGAIEARLRVLKRLQLAAFADAGAVYAESFPDLDGDYLVGAGGGVRYFSNIGPLRLDFATPLEKRPGDRDFHIYISIGQPF